MRRKGIVVLGTILVVLLLAPPAFARLAAVGPINPTNGFPTYYVDTNGVALEMTVPPFGTPIGTPQVAPTMVFDAPVGGNAYSQQIGFGTQAYYYNCAAQNLVTPYGTLTFQVGLMASFANRAKPVANNGDQIVLSRISSTLSSPRLPAGTYTLRHPYGVEKIYVAPGSNGLSFTRDIPLGPKLDFTTALNADVGPFLTPVTPPGTFPAAPPPFNTGWLGDGVSVGPVTGSPLPIPFNSVRLEGPPRMNLDGAGNNFVQTSNFVVSGHKFSGAITGTPMSVDRATYTRDNTNTFIDVFANSLTGAAVTAQIVPPTNTPLTAGTGPLAGLFSTRAQFATAGFVLPGSVSVTSQLGAATATTVTALLTDLVTITQAVWHSGTQTLTIAATSSDAVLNPSLNVSSPTLGAMTGGVLTVSCPVPPAAVTVISFGGGSATEMVQIITP